MATGLGLSDLPSAYEYAIEKTYIYNGLPQYPVGTCHFESRTTHLLGSSGSKVQAWPRLLVDASGAEF